MNKLIVAVGPSGSGKTSVMRQVMDNEIVSFTTRAPRAGEVPGVDYHFITHDEFLELAKNDELIEHITYPSTGDSYGISKKEFFEKIGRGPAFVVATMGGYDQLLKTYPNVIGIFFSVDRDEAEMNMVDRGDEPEKIKQRLRTFNREDAYAQFFNYIVRNERGQFDRTVEMVKHVLRYVEVM